MVALAVFTVALDDEKIKGLVENDLLLDRAELLAILAEILGQLVGLLAASASLRA